MCVTVQTHICIYYIHIQTYSAWLSPLRCSRSKHPISNEHTWLPDFWLLRTIGELGEMADSRAGAAKVQDELGLFYYTTKYKRVKGTHPKDTDTSLKGLPLAKYETI